jgi:uncharacterized membrane protein HdeD (DUF308 family)
MSSKWWWVSLVAGILWIILGFFVLQAHVDSALVIGYLVAFWLIFAGVAEFAGLAIGVGWRWLHIALGVLFLLGGFASLLTPFQTFMVLADIFGFLIILKGTFDLAVAISGRHVFEHWWLLLTSAILELALGIWAVGYPGRSAALLILWVGIGAIIRGVVEIISAFSLHAAAEMAVAA